jgi:hypothetical protein
VRRIAVRIEFLMEFEGFTESKLVDALAAQPSPSVLPTDSQSTVDEIVTLLGKMRNLEA